MARLHSKTKPNKKAFPKENLIITHLSPKNAQPQTQEIDIKKRGRDCQEPLVQVSASGCVWGGGGGNIWPTPNRTRRQQVFGSHFYLLLFATTSPQSQACLSPYTQRQLRLQLKEVGELQSKGRAVAYTDSSAKQVQGWTLEGWGVCFADHCLQSLPDITASSPTRPLSTGCPGRALPVHRLPGRISGIFLVHATPECQKLLPTDSKPIERCGHGGGPVEQVCWDHKSRSKKLFSLAGVLAPRSRGPGKGGTHKNGVGLPVGKSSPAHLSFVCFVGRVWFWRGAGVRGVG